MNKKYTLLLLAITLMCGLHARAQMNYTFSTASGSFTSISGTSAPLTNGTDDGWSNNIPLNFTFYYNGASTYTQAHASTNGFIALGTALATSYNGNALATTGAGNRPIIAPLWDDLESPTLTYATTGSVGSRVFTMQWNNVKWYYSSSTSTLNMQVKLYETTNVIEFRYSQINPPENTPSASIGITATGTGSGNFMSVQSITSPTVSTTSEFSSLNTVPASTVIYRFTPTFCTAAPTAGTATVATNTFNCTGAPGLNLIGATSGNGIQYVWESSPEGMNTWSAVSGTLTSPAFTAPAITENTDYRCVVTCSTTGVNDISTSVTVTILKPNAVLSGDATICEGDATNLTLTLSDGTFPYSVTYDDGSGPQVITGISASPYAFTVAPTLTTGYSLVSVSDANCAGTVSGTATVNVNPAPTAVINFTETSICLGESFDAIFSGTPDAEISYLDNGIPATVTLDNTGFNTVTITPTLSGSLTYVLLSVESAEGCVQSLITVPSATVNINDAPTATITNNGPSTICVGPASSLDINLGGSLGPWTFTYTDGTTNITETSYGGTAFPINVTLANTTTYSMVSLEDDINGCIAQPADISDDETIVVEHPVVITTQPTAITECTGNATSFTVVATGDGLTYEWLLDGNTITGDPNYTGMDQATLNIADISGLDGGSYSVVISGNCGAPVTSDAVILTEDLTNTWAGAVSTDWSDAGNWSCGIVPVVTTNVVIPTGATNMPLVDIPGAICNNLTLEPSTTVMFTGVGNQLELHGDINADGTIDGTGGKVLLAGTNPQQIFGDVTLEDLEIEGGTTKTLGSDLTVTGILSLTDGFLELGDFDFTIADVTLQTSGSATSFIVTNDSGVVVGQNMGVMPTMFHVGINSASYTPVMLENEGDADTFMVRVMEHVYLDGTGVDPETFGSPVVDRTWLVTEQTAGGSYVNMTPHWNIAEEINGFDQSHVYVGHHTGGIWNALTDDVTTAPAAGTSGALFTAFADSIDTFSPFAVASNGQFPLSVDRLSISGAANGNDVVLNWISINEKGLRSYDVERSLDGKSFEKIGNQKAIGTDKVSENRYSFIDNGAASLGKARLYYRLKTVNVSGSGQHTNTVVVNMAKESGAGEIALYPNPVGSDKKEVFVSMSNSYNEAISITVTDIHGRVVNTINLAAGQYNSTAIPVELRNLAQGVYVIRVVDANNTTMKTLKLLKE